jgi:hypothetical protein
MAPLAALSNLAHLNCDRYSLILQAFLGSVFEWMCHLLWALLPAMPNRLRALLGTSLSWRGTLPLAIGVALASLILSTRSSRRISPPSCLPGGLAHLAWAKLGRSTPSSTLGATIKAIFTEAYLPTPGNAHSLGSLTVLMLYCIWLFHYFGTPSWAHLSIGRANEVASGLAGIAIAIVILIAGTLRDGDPEARGRVTLQASLAFPIMSGALIALVTGAFWPEGVWLQLLPSLGLAVVAFAGIYRLLILFLKPGAMEQAQQRILSEDFRHAQEEVLLERMGNNLLAQFASEFAVLELRPGASFFPADKFPTRLLPRAGGVIADVNLEALNRFHALLASASPAASVGGQVEGTAESTTSTESNRAPVVPLGWLTFQFRSVIGPETPLFVVNPASGRTLPPYDVLQTALDKFVVIEDSDTFVDHFERIVDDLNSRVAAAIRSGDRKSVRAGTQHFRLLIDEYVALLTRLGVRFSADEALREQQSLDGMLATVDAPATAVVSLLELATLQSDSDILYEVMRMPYGIASQAIRARDALLLTRYAQVIERLMELSYAKGTVADQVHLIRDRAWRYYFDLSGLHLDLLLEGAPDEDTRAFVRAGVDILLASFGQSMKVAADHGDVETLRLMTGALSSFGPRLSAEKMSATDPDDGSEDA